jgi:Flp pilus assembly pilin Flp
MKKCQKGASLVEYSLLIALIALVTITAVRSIGNNVSTQFSRVNSGVNSN